jgi:hypothetical protein
MYLDVSIYLVIIILYVKSKFWNKQPMRHLWGFKSEGIIRTTPLWNKYCTINVYPSTMEEVLTYLKTKQFIKECSYLQNCYSSVYKINSEVKGSIISRKVKFFYPNVQDAYYHEYFVGDTETIKNSLFQTHEYNRMLKTKCMVSIFSTDKRIPWLVPATRYAIKWVRTYWFTLSMIPKSSFVKATNKNLIILYDHWKIPFLCQMNPSLISLADMIDSKKISIFYHYNENVLVAIFFFKNTFEMDKEDSILDWIGTLLLDKKYDVKKAISTLLYSIRKVYPIIRIHQLSDTPIYQGYKQSHLHYYIYNYGTKRIYPKDCFFL